MTTAMIEKLEVLMNDEVFVQNVVTCKSIDEVRMILETEGVEISETEWQGFVEKASDAMNAQCESEMKEEELDNVVGGVLLTLLGGPGGAALDILLNVTGVKAKIKPHVKEYIKGFLSGF